MSNLRYCTADFYDGTLIGRSVYAGNQAKLTPVFRSHGDGLLSQPSCPRTDVMTVVREASGINDKRMAFLIDQDGHEWMTESQSLIVL